MQPLQRKKRKVSLYALTAFIGILVLNPYAIRTHFHDVLHTILAPLLKVSATHGAQTQSKLSAVKNIFHIQRELNALQEKNYQLQARITMLEHLKEENNDLRAQLHLPKNAPIDRLGADIIYKHLGGDAWIIINRGEVDGVQKGDIITFGENIYVGHVFDQTPHTAFVRLSTAENTTFRVSKASSGESAVAHGSHGTTIMVEHIDPQVEISIGDQYLYAPEGPVLLQKMGLVVGAVQRVNLTPDRLSQTALLTPLYQIKTLSNVFIISHNI